MKARMRHPRKPAACGAEGLCGSAQQPGEHGSPEEYAAAFVSAEREIATPDDALQGARDIIAERIAHDPELRATLRDRMMADGAIRSTSTKLDAPSGVTYPSSRSR